jgi:CheY-like chemotaxis protein
MRMLFIEDDDVNRRIVSEMLTIGGAGMVAAVDGPSGLARLDEEDFDAILVDIRMPGMDGFEVIRRIRARGDDKAKLPVIVVTADTGTSMEEDCRAAGADLLLRKPIAIQELFEAVAEQVLAGQPRH